MTCKRTTISAGAHSLSKISLLYAVFQSYICSRVLPVSKCGKNLIFLIDFVLTLTYPVSLVFDQWTCAVLVSIVSWFLWNYSYCWNHCSKIIFKCVNSTVGPIFNEKVAKKWNLWVHEQYIMYCLRQKSQHLRLLFIEQ